MSSSSWKYALIVLLGGASYGFMAPVAKLAGSDGFAWQQIACSQAVFGVVVFAVALFVQVMAKGPTRAIQKVSPAQVLKLLGTGLMTCSTCVLYNYALSLLPVAAAITLLFQFTWIGVVIQIVSTRRLPHPCEVLAALLVVSGTLFASGLVASEAQALDPRGIACGIGSSITCALFMFLSSKVEVGMPRIQRGLIVCLGASLLGLTVCPDYFSSGILTDGIAVYGVVLGVTALFIPVLLFGIGTPYLPTGVSTILASAELPAGIALTYIATGVGVDAVQLFGILAILVGVVVAQIPSMRDGEIPH